MQSIKSISLYCDNLCEVELFPEDVEELTISDIGTDIAKFGDEFKMIDICDHVSMIIKRESNALLEAPYGEYGSLFNMLHDDHCVVSLTINWDSSDGDDECEDITDIYLPWEGDLTNDLMTTKITENGDLLLVISREHTVDSVFEHRECECCRH